MTFDIILIATLIPCLSQAFVHPHGDFVTAPGNNVSFICIYPSPNDVASIEWLANNTALLNVTFQDVGVTIHSNLLQFTRIPASFNLTVFSCVVTLTSGAIVPSSDTATLLLLQHFVPAVSSLNITHVNATLLITWSPPGTQNSGPITYCVDVVNSTSTIPSHSICDITETEYTYNLPAKYWCNIYFISIIPVNQALRGTTHTRRYTDLGDQSRPEVMNAFHMPGSLDGSSRNDTITQFCILNMSARVCRGVLTLVDLNTGQQFEIPQSDLGIMERVINFNSDHIVVNRHYSISVTAENRAGPLTSNTTISTHDVESVAIEAANGIKVATVYFSHSGAYGALFSFVFITNSGDVDFRRSFLLALDRNTSHNHTLPFDLYPGHYKVHVYDIEHNGTLHNGIGYPAVTIDETITHQGHPEPISTQFGTCDVHRNIPDHINVLCRFPTDTMATNIQVIAQSTNVSELHRLYIAQSMDLHTPVTVAVERDGKYQVSIFAIREGIGILDSVVIYEELVSGDDASTTSISNKLKITLSALAIILMTLLVVVVVIIMRLVMCSRTHNLKVDLQFPDLPEPYSPSSTIYTNHNLVKKETESGDNTCDRQDLAKMPTPSAPRALGESDIMQQLETEDQEDEQPRRKTSFTPADSIPFDNERGEETTTQLYITSDKVTPKAPSGDYVKFYRQPLKKASSGDFTGQEATSHPPRLARVADMSCKNESEIPGT